VNLEHISEDEILRNLCYKSFYHFFLEFWETVSTSDFVENWHIQLIAEECQKVYETWERGEWQPDMLNELCPGTSKTTTISQLFAVWLFVRNPTIRILFASYAIRVAEKISDKTRDCIKSAKFKRLFGNKVKIRRDIDNKGFYQLTAGGDRYTTSVDGSATSVHADFIFVDDGINAQEAYSKPKQEAAGLFVLDTVTTRKTNKKRTVTIYTGQRTSLNDPQGKLREAKGDKLNIICLPAELTEATRKLVSPERAIAFYEANDNLLDPKRLDREVLSDFKHNMGPYSYAAQFEQNPQDDSSGMFKRHNFELITWQQFNIVTAANSIVWDFDCDPALTDNTSNDPTGLMASCTIDGTTYIRHAEAVWKDYEQLLEYLPEFIKRNEGSSSSILYVEPKASGQPIVSSLAKRGGVIAKEAPAPTKDKIQRAHYVLPHVYQNNVKLIDGSWVTGFLQELTAFPNVLHDDLTDCLTQCLARALSIGVKKKRKMLI
jgi:predicted phage terminase large subunit-like protein